MKRKHFMALLSLVIVMVCTACSNSHASHCYLCEGIPYDEPCIVSLATGDIAVLSTGGYGHASLSNTGGVSVIGYNGESCRATLPIMGEALNPDLFCDDCKTLIDTTQNNGYVLADLHDLTDIQLYPIETGASYAIRTYDVTITDTQDSKLNIEVTNQNG